MPEIFTEGKIDFEKFQQLFADEISTESDRYQLNWAGKSAAYQTLQIPSNKTLTPCKAESVNFDETQNIFIEGENLDVLKVLQKSYFNSVKMIYIDPPYNTGNDFVYHDNFAQSQTEYLTQTGEKGEDGLLKKAFRKNSKENGHYHSNWLNMMLPRLHLARNLLKDDGVIFISIDDNEQAQLKLLCDEVFGEENFVAMYKWNKTSTPPSLSIKVRTKYEYIICYEKSKNKIAYNGGLIDGGDMPLLNAGNKSIDILFKKERVKFNISGKFLAGKYDNIILKTDIEVINGYANCDFILHGPFKWTQETVNQEIQNDTKFIVKSKKFSIRYARQGERVKRPSDILNKIECNVGTNEDANKDLENLFRSNIMDYPKPYSLIQYLIGFNENKEKDSIVMDFFAGSGTTAHAVMQLNAKDGGNRRFICVQLPELTDEKSEAYKAGFKNIAEIAKERIRRAGSQIMQKNSENAPLVDVGFKVFKLTESHFKQWQSPTKENMGSLVEQLEMYIDNVKENSDLQAVFYEILLRLGLKLTAEVHLENSVFWVNEDERLYAILLESVNEAILANVIAKQPQKVVALDRLFSGNDALKKNSELQMKDAGIAFFVI